METRSSLELMLEKLQQTEEDQPKDVPPTLPTRPVTKGRLPRTRRKLQFSSPRSDCEENGSLDVISSFEESVFTSQRTKADDLGQVVHQQESVEMTGVVPSAVAGSLSWLSREYLNSLDKKGKQLNEKTRNEIKVPYSVLVDLRRQALKTEALLDEKKEENALLQLKIQQLERRRERYEAKMKSMEKMWQDQLTSIQMNLAASRRNCASKNATGKLRQLSAIPETHDQSAHNASLSPSPKASEIVSLNSGGHFLEQQNGILTNDAGIINEVESQQAASNKNSGEVLQKLKLKFKAWKGDFKTWVVGAKTAMKKLGNSETRKIQRKWWGNMKKEEAKVEI